jgi:GNAT superfamily N-acetyltransferase
VPLFFPEFLMLDDFLIDLSRLAPLLGTGTYGFLNGLGDRIGFVQIVPFSESEVTVHRIWTAEPRKGHGSAMLRQLCMLADKHGIVLKLKSLPLGAKPYPFSRDELTDWYQRHGFAAKHRKMIRQPRRAKELAVTTAK